MHSYSQRPYVWAGREKSHLKTFKRFPKLNTLKSGRFPPPRSKVLESDTERQQNRKRKRQGNNQSSRAGIPPLCPWDFPWTPWKLPVQGTQTPEVFCLPEKSLRPSQVGGGGPSPGSSSLPVLLSVCLPGYHRPLRYWLKPRSQKSDQLGMWKS